MRQSLSDVKSCKVENGLYISKLQCVLLEEYSIMRQRYCHQFHKVSCTECKKLAEFANAVLTHEVIELSTIYRKHFGSYSKWDKAVRRTLQLPVVIFVTKLESNEKKSYVTKFQKNINYSKFVDWYSKMHRISKSEHKSALSSTQLKAVCQLASSESDRLLIRYAACESSGLSAKGARKVYGIDDFGKKKEIIMDALRKSQDIRSAVSDLAELQDKALLQSVGICLDDSESTDTSSSSDNDSDDCLDLDECDVQKITTENDDAKCEEVVGQTQVRVETGSLSHQSICEDYVISDSCGDLAKIDDKRQPKQNSGNKTDISFRPDSGLKGQPLANPCLSNDVMLSWLRENNLNWFSLVREISNYLKDYTEDVINHCLMEFSSFLPESDLTQEEENLVEISRQAYQDFCRNNNSDLSDTESDTDSDEGDWIDVTDIDSEKVPELVRKEIKKRKQKKRREMSKFIAEERLLKRKISKRVSRILKTFPKIGKDIEEYVSDRRVGADQWRRTGILTFTGNRKRGPKVTYMGIKRHLENLYSTKIGYGSVVQLCAIRNRRKLSAKRYREVANVTCRRARKGFSIKLNPDSHWSCSLYKGLDWIQLKDGRDKVVLNRDDQAGFRLDTTSTHKLGKSISTEPTLTTRTDFVNSYKSVLQTSSYLFMETGTTPVECVGVVKDHFTFSKSPAQHMTDLNMLEQDTDVNVHLKNKHIDCIRVDGASDEGPSHAEIQFLWGERHYKLGKICTLVTTRESGGSYLNKVELMNGCIAKAHGNLFIPSTLTGSNKGEMGLNELKVKENMDAALDVYLDHVDGAPCFGNKLLMKKGSKESELIDRRNDVLTFLKGKKNDRNQLKLEKPELFKYLEGVQKMVENHIVKQYFCKYIYMLLPCFKQDCIHPICKKGRDESNFDDIHWFTGGPPITYLPIPIPDKNNVGHYLSPVENYKESLKGTVNYAKIIKPPSEIIKEASATGASKLELVQETLLSEDEVQMHLDAIKDIAERRREGAKKAMETRKRKKKDVQVELDPPTASSETFCWCGGPEEGEMIHCENDDCRVGWFHFPCVGIYFPPSGKWLCPDCQTDGSTRTCYCNQGEYGTMLTCTKKECVIKYFHLACTGLKKFRKRFICRKCEK